MDLNNESKLPKTRSEPFPRTLYIVGTPIGNLGDLSPRAKSILKNVALIACEDTRRSGQLLKSIESKVPLLSYHKHNCKSRIKKILEILAKDGSVALISDAGLPGISDPGEELVKESRIKNHKVICIPGPCAATTALVISGLPSERFCFEGFLPQKQSTRKKRLKEISEEERTTIIYESPHQLTKLLKELISSCEKDRPIQIARELTKRYEETIGKTLEEVILYFEKNKPKGEFTLVLGGKPKIKNLVSESEAVNRLRILINKGEKASEASRKIANETGYQKTWLYSKIHHKLDK
tara:strand:- start:203 stop:1087 length:885 start_codon:yes stop_codon:yes gene_type:complete